MKKHLSKRLLSLFLAVVLLATSAPIMAFAYDSASLQEAVQTAQDAGTRYLFAYFSSNSQYGQQIRFAVSDDGLNYEPLNYNRPIIEHSDEVFDSSNVQPNTQYVGSQNTSAGYARDPYIFEGNDGKYYMVATDMDASTGGMHESWTGDTCFAIWQSNDLINWYQKSIFDVRDLGAFQCTDGTTRYFDYTLRAWAPQVIWDEAKGAYLLYWSNFMNDWYESIFGVYTTDFETFDISSTVEMYHALDAEGNNTAAIDGDITYYNGKYYLFYKQESTAEVGCVTSDTLTGPYDQSTYVDCTYSDDGVAVEGCQVYQIGDSNYYVLMLDEYVNGSFVLGITDDLSSLNFEKMNSTDYSLSGFSPRHGSVIQINAEQYQLLLDTYTYTPEIGSIEYIFSNERTDSNSGWYWAGGIDNGTGHTYDVIINSTEQSSSYGNTTTPYATMSDGELNLYCSEIAINDPDVEEYLFSGNFTITFDYTKKSNDVVINGSQVYDFSRRPIISIAQDNQAQSYIYLLNDGTLSVYNGDGTYSSTSSTRSILEGENISYTLTYDGTEVVLYMDYVRVASISTPNGLQNFPENAAGLYCGFGFDDVAGNGTGIYGSYDNLCFYDRAFTKTEAQIDMPLTLDSLEACVSSFESIVTSGNIYMNTPEAYQYYKEALRLIEVRDYGTVDTEILNNDIATCTENFRNAINNLVLWTPDYQSENRYTSYMGQEQIKGNVLAADGDMLGGVQDNTGWLLDDNDIAAGLTGDTNYEARFGYNIKEGDWTDIITGHQGDFIQTGENFAMNVYGNSYIAVYDGENETSFPVKVMYFRDDSNTDDSHGLQSIYLANNNLTIKSQEENRLYLYSLNDNEANATDFMWPTTYMHAVANKDMSGLGFNDTAEANNHQYGYFSAVVNSDAFNGAENNLLIINPNVVFTDAVGNKLSWGNGGQQSYFVNGYIASYSAGWQDDRANVEITADEIGAVADGNSATYYVINVEPIRTALEEGAQRLTTIDLSTLSETDMLAAFEAADAMMNFNPYTMLNDYRDSSGYISKSSMEEAATAVADRVDELVSAYDEEATTIDVDGYNLLNALRTNVEINTMYVSNNANNYTTDSWETFVTAYEASVNKVNELRTEPFENALNEDGTTNTTIQDIVEDVYAAYYGLRQRASFDELEETVADEEVNQKYEEDLGGDITSEIEQNYTIGSWLDFQSAYDEAEKFLTDNADTSNIPMYDEIQTTITTDTGITFEDIYVEDPTNTSDQVDTSIAMSEKVIEKMNALVAPAPDYDVYDAFMVVYGTQDMNAFADDYLALDTSIQSLAVRNGTKTSAQEYVVDSGATAYAMYNGHIYKNAADTNDQTYGGDPVSAADTIDGILTTMITELNDANNDKTTKRQSYTVTFELYKNDQYVKTLKDAEIHYYGDVVALNADEQGDLGDLTCYKWVVESADDPSAKEVVNASNTYNVRIQSDSVIKAYYSDNSETPDTVPVEITNQYGNVIQTVYLTADDQITLGTKSVTAGQEVYNIADMPFYAFSGNWRVNGTNYSNGAYTVAQLLGTDAAEIEIKPVYTATDGGYTITLDGQTLYNNVGYDDRYIVTTDENAYALLIRENGVYSVVSYSNEYEFYANRSMDFYTLTYDGADYAINDVTYNSFTEDELYRLNNKMPFVYSAPKASGDNGDKFTTFSAYSTNVDTDNITITEVGTLYTTDANLANADSMEYGNEGVSFIKSKVQGDTSNQYSLTFSGAENILNSGTMIYTRAYVKYSYTYTTSNGQSTTIQAIAYGNIVNDSAIF